MLRLPQRLGQSLVLIDLSVELKLEAFLRSPYQEVSDCLWDCISYIADCELEVGVDAGSDFSYKEI